MENRKKKKRKKKKRKVREINILATKELFTYINEKKDNDKNDY